MEWYITLVLVVLGIISHEFGHVIGYKLFDRKYNMYWTKYGALHIEDTDIYTNTPRKMRFIAWFGILTGLPFFIFLPSGVLVYMVLSMFDIHTIFVSYNKNIIPDVDKTYGELLELEYEEYMSKRGD